MWTFRFNFICYNYNIIIVIIIIYSSNHETTLSRAHWCSPRIYYAFACNVKWTAAGIWNENSQTWNCYSLSFTLWHGHAQIKCFQQIHKKNVRTIVCRECNESNGSETLTKPKPKLYVIQTNQCPNWFRLHTFDSLLLLLLLSAQWWIEKKNFIGAE